MTTKQKFSLHDHLNAHKSWFLWTGLLLFSTGVVIGVLDHYHISPFNKIATTAISHLLIALGEALGVFFGVNVVLEKETKKEFFDIVKNQVSEVDKLLKQQETDVSEHIKLQENKISETFHALSSELTSVTAKATNLVDKMNDHMFKLILQERTCPEIAKEISENDFFSSQYLKTSNQNTYTFFFKDNDERIYLHQDDQLIIKNISKNDQQYEMSSIITSTDSKKYNLLYVGVNRDLTSKEYETVIDKFKTDPSKKVKGGLEYRLEQSIPMAPNSSIKISRLFETIFQENPDGIDDYFFTTQYMMPFDLNVVEPEGYEFNLYPTFPEKKLGGPYKRGKVKVFTIPFLFPGQGFSFSLIKKK